MLFVPANRPDRFDKALMSGADMICIDLEDALLAKQKDQVRQQALDYVIATSPGRTLKALRINQLGTVYGLRDLLALASLEKLPRALLLPKVGHSREIQLIRQILGEKIEKTSLFALLETPEGIANAAKIAMQPGVDTLLFGSADWAAECGSDMSWDSLLTPRCQVVQAAAQAGISAMDGVWPDFNDDAGLRGETGKIARMGFSGKAVLHPKQVATVHKAFAPSQEELAGASKILEAFANNQDGVQVVDGRMIDKPLISAARRTLFLAAMATIDSRENLSE